MTDIYYTIFIIIKAFAPLPQLTTERTDSG